jgi:hypothetical protein
MLLADQIIFEITNAAVGEREQILQGAFTCFA